jgi:hypothetical protein
MRRSIRSEEGGSEQAESVWSNVTFKVKRGLADGLPNLYTVNANIMVNRANQHASQSQSQSQSQPQYDASNRAGSSTTTGDLDGDRGETMASAVWPWFERCVWLRWDVQEFVLDRTSSTPK